MLTYSFFKNKRVTVFGLGLNTGGVGVVEFLIAAGVREVIVTDIKSRSELTASLAKLKAHKNITYVLGQHRPEDFTRVDMVIKNPIIPWTNEYVKLAEKNGIPVEMDSSIFFALCKRPIIGITGSKGKTSTSELIAHLLEKAGKKVVRIGMGQVSVLGRLARVTEESTVVFELSSWRLSALKRHKKSPHIAVMTNIFPDHLNYYRSLEAYIDDKKNIYRFQKEGDTLVANYDDVAVRNMGTEAPATVRWVSQEYQEGSAVWMEDGAVYEERGGEKRALVALSDMRVPGPAMQSNVLLAVAVARLCGLPKEAIVSGIRSFTGVLHRLESVGEKNGVQYYNDTTATIPEAAIASLRSFSAPVILLCGGTDKRLDFSQFAKEIVGRTKGVVFFRGSATEKILAAVKAELSLLRQERNFPVVDTMEEALREARALAVPGDIILLSPGATSFGLFDNEFDRGEQFRKLAVAEA